MGYLLNKDTKKNLMKLNQFKGNTLNNIKYWSWLNFEEEELYKNKY